MIVCVYKVKFTIQARNHEQTPSPNLIPFYKAKQSPKFSKGLRPLFQEDCPGPLQFSSSTQS